MALTLAYHTSAYVSSLKAAGSSPTAVIRSRVRASASSAVGIPTGGGVVSIVHGGSIGFVSATAAFGSADASSGAAGSGSAIAQPAEADTVWFAQALL